MKRIIIADEYPILRLGISYLIKNIFSNSIITEVENYKQLLSFIVNQDYDIIILDLDIPGGSNINMIHTLKSIKPSIKILIFSTYKETLFATGCIKIGAEGYLSKEASNLDFELAIKTILNNQKYLSNKIKEECINMSIKSRLSNISLIDQLSSREKEIVQLLITGRSTSEIANILNIHSSTVSTHKNKIFQKLNISNTFQLNNILKVNDEVTHLFISQSNI